MNTEPDIFAGPGPDTVYREAVAAGEFRIQRCSDCGSHGFYPRVLCKRCGSAQLEWVPASGRATVYSTTVVRQRPEAGPDFNIALVELAEGPRMMTRVVDIEPEAVRIGMAVQAFVGEVDGEAAVLFKPVSEERQ